MHGRGTVCKNPFALSDGHETQTRGSAKKHLRKKNREPPDAHQCLVAQHKIAFFEQYAIHFPIHGGTNDMFHLHGFHHLWVFFEGACIREASRVHGARQTRIWAWQGTNRRTPLFYVSNCNRTTVSRDMKVSKRDKEKSTINGAPCLTLAPACTSTLEILPGMGDTAPFSNPLDFTPNERTGKVNV